MKRLLSLLVVLGLLLACAACGAEPTPVEKCRQKAVSIGEQLLDYEITADEAVELLDSLIVPEVEGINPVSLSADIAALAFSIRTESSYEQIQRKVEYIRTAIYE